MYTAKIVTDAGKTFDFSYRNGVVFDISPLSGTDVSLSTSQGFGQIGETVEGMTVKGIRRTIRGVILHKSTAKQMLSVLPAFAAGRLYVNGAYFCPITVQKTPTVSESRSGRLSFTMQVFCDTPYWYKSSETSVLLTGVTPMFSFPVDYSSHKFGESMENAFVNVFNDGDVPVPIDLRLSSSGSVSGYGIADTRTGAVLKFDDTLSDGEQMRIRQIGGRIVAEKTSSGEVSGALAYITDESSLFSLSVGDNVLTAIADEGLSALRASVQFNAAYMGVIP